MLHYAIGFFLKATRTQIPPDKLEIKPQGRVEATHPPILYWRHLDMGGAQSGHKRKRQVVMSESESDKDDSDSGQEESYDSFRASEDSYQAEGEIVDLEATTRVGDTAMPLEGGT